MEVKRDEALEEQVFNNIRSIVDVPRDGIHLSDLIYCSRKAYFRKKGLAPTPSKELCLLWLTGYAFQAYMFPADKEQTFLIDGVDCTPDIPSGIEVKSTRQSYKYFDLLTNVHWKRQILGYCKALNKTHYSLVVMFVCGNYAPPFPDIQCFAIQTTQEEIDANWGMVLNQKKKLVEALEQNIPPEPDCEDWEWEYCDCIDLCPDTVCANKKRVKEMSKRKRS